MVVGACDTMPCYHPVYAVRTATGAVRIGYDGRDGVHRLDLPCGRCIGCVKRKALELSIRGQLEHSLWPCGRMLTLTYSHDTLPADGSLRRRDFTLFAKRLRKAVAGVAECDWKEGLRPLRILACGEYGSSSRRPHYHAVVSNLRLPDETPAGGRGFHSETLSRLWGLGHVRLDEVTPASIGYVSGYVRKKLSSRRKGTRYYESIDEESGELHKLEPEFVQTPVRPGLGLPWLWRFSGDLGKQFVTIGGKSRPVPRYFVKKLVDESGFAEKRERFVFDVVRRASLDGRPPSAIRAAQELMDKALERTCRRDAV